MAGKERKLANPTILSLLGIGFSGILVGPLDNLFASISWSDGWEWIAAPKVSYLTLIVVLILMAVVIVALTKMASVAWSKERRIEKKLKKYNSAMISDDVKATWDVVIGEVFNNDPFPYNIKLFCMNHGDGPLLMNNSGCCVHSECPNHHANYIESRVKHLIQSDLLNLRNQLRDRGRTGKASNRIVTK